MTTFSTSTLMTEAWMSRHWERPFQPCCILLKNLVASSYRQNIIVFIKSQQRFKVLYILW